MNLVWSHDNISIPEVSTTKWVGMQLIVSGTGWKYDREHVQHFQWDASVNDKGWYISLTASNGKRGEWQGAGFNLALEVATAARRVL